MNTTLLDVYCFQTYFGSAASAFENIEFIFIAVLLWRVACVSLIWTTYVLARNYKHKVWESETDKVH